MTDDDSRKQRLNIRALRVSRASALRGLPADAQAPIRARANALLDQARRTATDPRIRAEIEALQAEWEAEGSAGEEDDAAR
jgi:hypothetical protein